MTQPMAAGSAGPLEDAVAAIETRLAALGSALRERDALAIEAAAQRQRDAVGVAIARGQVAAQRETLARANAALDRAMNVLLPPDWPAPAYAADGARARQNTTGAIGV
jgi:lipopolysaccharide export system protein LptA